MKHTFILVAITLLAGCAAPHKTSRNLVDGGGDTRTKEVEMLDDKTFLLKDVSQDKTYGFDRLNPIKVGGVSEQIGPLNERRFLNGLLGPNGERIGYFRSGSCCYFKTPHGLIDNMGSLDRYKVYCIGSKDTVTLYINMYDKGDLQIPVGFTAKK